MSELVRLSRDGEIAVITIENPPVNALSPGVPEGISECIDQVSADDTQLYGVGAFLLAASEVSESQLAARHPHRSPSP